MRRFFAGMLLLLQAAVAGIVSDVRVEIGQHDLKAAGQLVFEYRKQNGVTPELIEAVSWFARGALAERQFDQAEASAAEARKLVQAELKSRSLDTDKHLSAALGAAIEVHAQVLAERGERAEAVSFLRREVAAYRDTSIRARIQKNLNLLTLEGKPAPALDVREWLGPRPKTLAALRGRPVLLFFWAHWCPDCKAQIPALVKVEDQFSSRGLVLVGPTQHYGYVARGEEAPRAQETRYIDDIRVKLYSALRDMPVPLSEENFKVYGASTVPTLVLIDRRGIVRMYHPDVMPYEELAAQIEKALPIRSAR